MNKKISLISAFVLGWITIYAQERVSITDYGSNPNDRKNVIMAIRSALKVCATKDSSVLVFPKGRYDFWPDFTSDQVLTRSNAPVGFQIEKLKHLTIDGSGSEFIFHGTMMIASIDGCENVTLRNFSVDWDHPYIVQGQYVEATDEYVDLKFDPEVYVIEDNQFYLVGESWKTRPTTKNNIYDKDKKEILYKTHDGDNNTVFATRAGAPVLTKAEEIKPGIVRFYGKPKIKPEPGTYQTLYAGSYLVEGIFITESKDTYLKDLTIYHALSNGVRGIRSENITLDNVNITANEKKGRVFSTLSDGTKAIGCKGLIKLINCKHTGLGDDFINLHGTYLLIGTINDEYSVTTGGKSASISLLCGEGDEVWFFNKNTSQRGEVRTVKSTEPIVSANGKSSGTKIVFTQPIPKTVQAGDFIENKTWTAGLEIRNCEITKRFRSRGILVTTPQKVIIENNYFRTAGTAILIEGDTDFWFESGANTDVSIRNNVFEDCLTSGCEKGRGTEWGEAIITITPSHRPENEKTEPYHKNIKIENNTFKTFDIPLVHARSVRGLTFNNNEVIRTYTYKPYAWQNCSFLLDGCREVNISGNRIAEDYSTRVIEFEHMKKTDVKVDKNQKFTKKAFDQSTRPIYINEN